MPYRDNRGPAPFLAINPRVAEAPAEQRFEDMGTQGLSGLNDPSSDFYQMLVNALDGISGGGIEGLPSLNMENAGTNAALYLAIALTAGTMGSLPLQVFEDDENGGSRKIKTPDTRFLWRHPNSEETPQEFWETAFAHRTLAGDMFLYCERDGLGRVVELYTIHPMRMQVGRDPRSRRKVYVLDGNLDEPPMFTAGINEGEILHIRNLTWAKKNNGLRGFGLIDLAKLELQLDKGTLQHALTYLAQGGIPSGIITSDADIEDDIAERLVKRWQKANGGIRNRGKVAVLGSGGKFQQTSGTPAETQSIEVRTGQVKMIARFTGVPTHMLMDSTGSTTWGTGLENIGQGFVTYTLNRMSTPVQQALERILPDNRHAKWNYGALLRGNMLQRMQAYQIGRIMGAYSNDEIREWEDMPAIVEADLWKYQQPLNSNISGALGPGGDATLLDGDLQAQIDDLKKQLDGLKSS